MSVIVFVVIVNEVIQASFTVSLNSTDVSTMVPPGAVALTTYSVSAATSAPAVDLTFNLKVPASFATVIYEGTAALVSLFGWTVKVGTSVHEFGVTVYVGMFWESSGAYPLVKIKYT